MSMGLVSQYHMEIPDCIDATSMSSKEVVPKDETAVYKTETAYVIFPKYSELELVCKTRPSRQDESITWCSGAAFQHSISLLFSHDDIEGDYATNGSFYKSPYDQKGFVAFVFANGTNSFEYDNPSQAIQQAAEAGGSGFMQYGLRKDGEELGFGVNKLRCYRALSELNGHLCIIDSIKMTYFDEFMEELHRLKVTNALYMDMGAGWNYSWFRDAANSVMLLFGLPVPWSHNWIIFKE